VEVINVETTAEAVGDPEALVVAVEETGVFLEVVSAVFHVVF